MISYEWNTICDRWSTVEQRYMEWLLQGGSYSSLVNWGKIRCPWSRSLSHRLYWVFIKTETIITCWNIIMVLKSVLRVYGLKVCIESGEFLGGELFGGLSLESELQIWVKLSNWNCNYLHRNSANIIMFSLPFFLLEVYIMHFQWSWLLSCFQLEWVTASLSISSEVRGELRMVYNLELLSTGCSYSYFTIVFNPNLFYPI